MAVGGGFSLGDPGSNAYPQVLEVDWIRVSAPRQAPRLGAPIPVPGPIEPAWYDEGWLRQACFDAGDGNSGSVGPEGDVDFAVTDEGELCIADIEPGEWVEYTIEAQAAGVYDVQTLFVSEQPGASLAVGAAGGTPVRVALPATSEAQPWQTVSARVPLAAGEQVLRVGAEGDAGALGGVLLGRWTLERAGACPADLNGDAVLNLDDVSLFVDAYVRGDAPADVDSNGLFDTSDIGLFVEFFLVGCE